MATLQNIGKLKYRGKDGLWHPLPVVVQDAGSGVSTISGKGAPTSETQGKVNQLYRDEDTQKLYICTATDGGYTWAEVSGGGGGGANVTYDETTGNLEIASSSGGSGGSDGKSAYEIAVEQGFTGTEAEWIASLHGSDGENGITPHIGDNGNWYIGETDTGVSAAGEKGETGPAGADGNDGAQGSAGKDGKSAYQYAQDGGYTGTEAEFAAKLAQEKFANPNALTFTGAVTGSYDGSAPVSVEIPSGGSGGDPTIIFDSGEIAEEVNLIGPIDISQYSRLRIFGKAYPSENSAGKRPAQLYFGDLWHRLLCNAGTGKLFDTSGNPVSFIIYLNIGANALSAFSFSGFNAGFIFDDSNKAVSSQAIQSDGGCLVYSTTYDLTKMYLSAQDDLSTRPWGVGTRIMVIGDD